MDTLEYITGRGKPARYARGLAGALSLRWGLRIVGGSPAPVPPRASRSASAACASSPCSGCGMTLRAPVAFSFRHPALMRGTPPHPRRYAVDGVGHRHRTTATLCGGSPAPAPPRPCGLCVPLRLLARPRALRAAE